MRIHETPDRARLPGMSADELRRGFLIDGLFRADAVELVHWDLDRAVIGGAVPVTQKLVLPAPPALRAATLTERRELGVLNLGGPGSIAVDGRRYPMASRDALYVGRGAHAISFESDHAAAPARFYLVSYPAHQEHPTRHASFAAAEPVRLGTRRDANERTIYKYIHEGGIQSCQLVMGLTLLEEGSVWNTMPPHRHLCRTEIYLYFDLPSEACLMHFMGEPAETRHLVVRNEQAVLSPSWSIHVGAGTRRYGFIWSMGGENREFADMEAVPVPSLR
jgi:4-deoxy-L-threo-5-hexosulose-uronate ketol-isomerase